MAEMNHNADRAGRLEQRVMPCVPFHNGIFCYSPRYRLRLLDGRYVWMDWHHYCGATFYRDRLLMKPIEDWWKDDLMLRAVEWFRDRGCKA